MPEVGVFAAARADRGIQPTMVCRNESRVPLSPPVTGCRKGWEIR